MTKFLEKLKKPSFLAILDQICPFLGKMNFPEKLGSARFYLQSSTTIQKIISGYEGKLQTDGKTVRQWKFHRNRRIPLRGNSDLNLRIAYIGLEFFFLNLTLQSSNQENQFYTLMLKVEFSPSKKKLSLLLQCF